MKAFTIPTAKNLDTGEVREIRVDPHVYTSVADWKPIAPEKFVGLLHTYKTQDHNLDEFGHGLMHAKAFHLGGRCTAVIHYSVKEQDSPVSSPVLMTITYEDSKKVICFAALHYGLEAEGQVGTTHQ